MVEPTTAASAVFSGLNALLIIVKQSANFVAVPAEVTQLQINVRLADHAIGTARRLQRLNARVLDDDLQADVDRSVAAVEEILALVRDAIEACRRDLEIRKTVGWRNRTAWLIWRKEEFVGKLSTLTNALAVLNRDVERMELCARLNAVSDSIAAVPAMGDGARDHNNAVDDEDGKPVAFPRRPTMRRRPRSRQRGLQNDDNEDNDSKCAVSFGDAATLIDDNSSSALSGGGDSTQHAVRGVGTNGRLLVPALYQVHSAPSQISLSQFSDMAELPAAVDGDDDRDPTTWRASGRRTGHDGTVLDTDAFDGGSGGSLGVPRFGNTESLLAQHSAAAAAGAGTSRDLRSGCGGGRRRRSNFI